MSQPAALGLSLVGFLGLGESEDDNIYWQSFTLKVLASVLSSREGRSVRPTSLARQRHPGDLRQHPTANVKIQAPEERRKKS
jgi:hypothetical protein